MHSRSQAMLRLLVEGEGITHSKHPHRLIACYQTPVEGWSRKPRRQGLVGQFRRRRHRRLQCLQRTAMEDGAPRFTRLRVDDRTDLLMGEYVAPSSHGPSLTLRLIQQAAVQDFVQGGKSVLFFEIGHLTQALKRDSLAEDSSCHQQGKGMRCESIQACHDHFAHTRWEKPALHHLMLHGCCNVQCPPSLFARAGGEHATLEQDLECFHQIKGLSVRFSKEPLY